MKLTYKHESSTNSTQHTRHTHRHAHTHQRDREREREREVTAVWSPPILSHVFQECGASVIELQSNS
jgi:hypothetical protein